MDLAAQASPLPNVWPKGAGPRLVLNGPPEFELGSAVGPEPSLLDGVTGAFRTSARQVVVGDGGNNRISFFDEHGRFVRSVGRAGDGPGEFRQQRWVGQCADGSIAAQEGARGILVMFSSDGKLEGNIRLPPDANFDQVLWCSGRGELLILMNRPRDEVARGTEPVVSTALLRVAAGRTDTVMKPGPRDFYIGRAVAALTNLPLGRDVLAGAGKNRVFVCSNHEGRCTVLDSAGTTVGTFTLEFPNGQVDDAGWQAALREHLQLEPSRRVRKIVEKLLTEIKPRTAFPKIDQVFADRLDRLWVRTLDNFGTPWATWVILSSEGRSAGMIALPRRVTPRDAGVDYLLGSSRDDDDVEHVAYYRLAWPK